MADPSKVPPSDRYVGARPDDAAEGNASWRDLLVQYNQTPSSDPFGLLPAIDLYENDAYRQLAASYLLGPPGQSPKRLRRLFGKGP